MTDTFAVVRVRGIRSMEPRIKRTLELLLLNKPNHCIITKYTDAIKGMLCDANDYIAFGRISQETLALLLKKRGEIGSKSLQSTKSESEISSMAKEILAGKKVAAFLDPVFRLHPPRRGYKNIKLHYPRGDLGERESMDDLIRRMI